MVSPIHTKCTYSIPQPIASFDSSYKKKASLVALSLLATMDFGLTEKASHKNLTLSSYGISPIQGRSPFLDYFPSSPSQGLNRDSYFFYKRLEAPSSGAKEPLPPYSFQEISLLDKKIEEYLTFHKKASSLEEKTTWLYRAKNTFREMGYFYQKYGLTFGKTRYEQLEKIQIEYAQICKKLSLERISSFDKLQWLFQGLHGLQNAEILGEEEAFFLEQSCEPCQRMLKYETGISLWKEAAKVFKSLPSEGPLDLSFLSYPWKRPFTPALDAQAQCLSQAASLHTKKANLAQRQQKDASHIAEEWQAAIHLYQRASEAYKMLPPSAIYLHEQTKLQESTITCLLQKKNYSPFQEKLSKKIYLKALQTEKLYEKLQNVYPSYEYPFSANLLQKAKLHTIATSVAPDLDKSLHHATSAYILAVRAWRNDRIYCTQDKDFRKGLPQFDPDNNLLTSYQETLATYQQKHFAQRSYWSRFVYYLDHPLSFFYPKPTTPWDSITCLNQE